MKITDKKTLRKIIKDKRKTLTAEYIKYADEQICRNILSMKEYQNAQAVFCFVGTKDEIDTEPILKQVLADGKKLLVPKCHIQKEDCKGGLMDAYRIASLDQLEPGAYGILEPVEEAIMVEPWEIDFAVIPCLSCDRAGHRLGQGGGYYDRYLQRAELETKCLSQCEAKEIGQRKARITDGLAKSVENADYCPLKNCFPRAVVCRELLLSEAVPCEATDQDMDFVVTEAEILKL